jgi:hypothetical protein
MKRGGCYVGKSPKITWKVSFTALQVLGTKGLNIVVALAMLLPNILTINEVVQAAEGPQPEISDEAGWSQPLAEEEPIDTLTPTLALTNTYAVSDTLTILPPRLSMPVL